MMNAARFLGVALATIFALLPSFAEASVVMPPGLLFGDTYHFAFVTDGTRDGTSSDIADYNRFVQQEAERAGAPTAALNALWFAVVSTQTVSARTNALVQGPVFLIDGTQLSDEFADFWSGSLDALFNLTQFGEVSTAVDVYTGGAFGSSHPSAYLGSQFPIVGTTTLADDRWSGGLGLTINANTALPFFALSEALHVPIPEPFSAAVWIGLIVAIAPGAHRRLRRASVAT